VITVLDPGGYGAVTIIKSITIDGGGNLASILAAGTNGVNINAGINDVVVLRGLWIDGAGTGRYGVNIQKARTVHIEDTTIQRFRAAAPNPGQGIHVALSAVEDSPARNTEVFVSNSVIHNNLDAGIYATAPATVPVTVSVVDSRLLNNGSGADIRSNASLTIRESTVTGNTAAGIQVQPDTGLSDVNADRTLLAFNGTGVQSGGNARAATVRLSNSTVANNVTGIAKQNPAVVLTAGNNRIVANDTNGTFSAPVGTPPPAPTAVVCAPRPKVTVSTAQTGPGQLAVTITATTTPDVGSATNTIQSLRFASAQNSTISGTNVPAGSTGGITVPLPGGTSTTTLVVQRTTAGQAFTVPFTIRDGCGDWPSFVGGGASAS